jgi:Zn-dependent peptidase ImmA (M78 family)/transcriptional regulator with XRE-family HTH domain
MPQINPNLLIWARETAGLSIEAAAKKLGLSGPERLQALEGGQQAPSRRQLINMSEKYHRPLLTFYLPSRPQDRDRGQDFRTLPGLPDRDAEALLDALLRDVQARQQLVRAAFEEMDEDTRLSFINSGRMADGVEALVASIQDVLGVGLEEFRKQKNVTDAFALLRSRAEKAGVFVLLMGNLGTHHTDIGVRVFRGFALVDNVAPFVIINDKDSRAAWSFTLLHELAHIWLGQTGISGYGSEDDVERFCDSVAASFLLNPEELEGIAVPNAAIQELKERIGTFAGPRNPSRKMVAYNLLRSRHITAHLYAELSAGFDADNAARKEEEKGEGGPDYYVVRRHRLGLGLADLVKRMVAAGALSTPKAGKVLGVKATAVDRLVGRVG